VKGRRELTSKYGPQAADTKPGTNARQQRFTHAWVHVHLLKILQTDSLYGINQGIIII
jgi:hypothetical protein